MKKILMLMVTVAVLFFASLASASEFTHLEGEDEFNETAEKIIEGNFSPNPVDMLQKCIDDLFDEIKQSRSEMVSLLVIAALSGIFKILKTDGNAVDEPAFFACFIMISTASLNIFRITVDYGAGVINEISTFVTKLAPLLMATVVSTGGVSSAAAFHPVLSGAVYVMSLLIHKCIIPMVYLSAVLGIVSNITPKLQISSVTKLIRSAGKWMLTAALTIFTGITAIYGFSAPVFDAVALKTLKFAVGSFVPVVGGILTDSVETVLGSTQLMKNAIGVAGIVSLGVLCLVPILKILAILIMLEVTAAASEPLTDPRITKMLKDISSAVSLVLGMVITMSMLFIISIAIIAAAT